MTSRPIFSTLCLFLLIQSAFAIRPPKTGSIPEHLWPVMDRIQKEYGEGFWAARMRGDRLFSLQKGMQILGVSGAADTVNAPVLLGCYSNANNRYSANAFQNLLFDGPNPTGTMTDYYLENSYGRLVMTGKAKGWYTVARAFAYYVNDGGSGTKQNVGLIYGGRDFVIDLVIAADDSIDFSKFVKYVDAEGAHVPQLGVVHTGGDAAAGANNIWSHRWNIRSRLLERKNNSSETIITDKSRILSSGRYRTNDLYQGLPVIIDGDYAIQPELNGNSNESGSLVEIGVFAHEFGHVFGLPDLYDRTNKSEGLGNWCLMASGSYGGDGSHESAPAHMSAWCKEKMGWVKPTIVSSFLPNQPIKNIEVYPEVFKLYVRSGQYFLVENRQRTRFDRYIPVGGLLIYHVDSSVVSSQNDNPDHYFVDLEQADGLRNLNIKTNRGDAGDPFPGTTANTTFDGYSKPNSLDYTSNQTYIGVRKISNPDTIMYADFDIGSRPYIRIDSLTLTEANPSNTNGRVEAGERGTISIKMINIYPVALTAGKIRFSFSSDDLVADTTATDLSIGSLSTATVILTSYVSAKPTSVPKTLTVAATVETPQGNFSNAFEVVLGYPQIVLVDMDSIVTDNIYRYYQGSLKKYGAEYEQVRALNSTLPNIALHQRSTVLWFSGKKQFETIPMALEDSLTSFVLSGGKLFMTGQNIAEDLNNRNSTLLSSVLKAQWTGNMFIGRNVHGYFDDYFGGQLPGFVIAGGDGARNQTSPDVIAIDSSTAHPSFWWNFDSVQCAGLWWENPTVGTKVVFWSFGFEAINDSVQGSSTREQALAAIMNWFKGITSSPSIENRLPFATALYQNYPNPFNPSTTVDISLAGADFGSLKIYDILGRVVAILADGYLPAGHSVFQFDGTHLSSGTYFVILRTAGTTASRKMNLVK